MKKLISLILTLVLCLSAPVLAQKEYEPFSEDASTRHAKRMLKVFEALSEEKWETAYKRLEDIEKQAQKMQQKHPEEAEAYMGALRPLPELAYALLEMAPEAESEVRPARDVWAAYERLKKVEADSRYRRIDSYLSLIEDAQMRMANIMEQIEEQLHEETAAQHTVAAYDKLLNVLRRRSKIKDTLVEECEQIAYDDVLKVSDVEQCNAYLKRFAPVASAAHRSKVTDHRDRLAYEKAPATEQGMRQYIEEYPQSKMKEDAMKRLYEYAYQGLEHSEDAYRTYLSEFPKSPYAEAARDSMAACAWRTTEADSTFSAWDAYCRKYPQSKQIGEARRQRILAGRNEYIRLGILDMPDDLRQDTLVANFLRSKAISIYGGQTYGVHYARVDTIMETTFTPKGEAYRKMYAFNVDGLIIREKHSQQGATDYVYAVEPGIGFYLQEKGPLGGKKTTYSPQFAPDGMLLELTASDGSRETYDYNEADSSFVRSCFAKGAKSAFLKETYKQGRIVEANKQDGRTVYEYNAQGDVAKTIKYNGAKTTQTNFEYTYDEHGCWTECRQTGTDGKLQQRKTRTYSHWASEKGKR